MVRQLTVLALGLFLVTGAHGESHVELILDASGSMYNKLDDGRYRITAAKDVLRDFVGSLPTGDLHVGLRVYGSEKQPEDEDSCQDSKLFVPLQGVDRAALLDTIRDTRARGSTPIAFSLDQAAADFPETAERCVIVLVTDGKEVCDGDVRASAAKLKERGCDIDLRIIGFDLSDDAIASFQGVGTFEHAKDAGELAAALGRAVDEVVQKAPLGSAVLTAAEEVVAGAGFEVGWEALEGDRDYVTVVPVGAKEGSYGSYAYTASGNPVKLHAPIAPGEYELRYQSDRVPGVSGRRAIRIVPAEIALEAPTEIPAGQPFEVSWIGPDGNSDYLTIVTEDAPAGTYRHYRYTKEGSPLRLHASIEDGPHEIRYQSDRVKGVFARRPVLVIPADIRLDAPAVVSGGSPFEVQWQGPDGDKDYLTIVPATAPDGQYTNYRYTNTGSPVRLHAPAREGDYEVRYQSDREKGVFARLEIRVDPVDAGLEAPQEVAAGTSFQVSWHGPDGDGDYVTIVAADALPGTYASYSYTRSGPTLKLTAPDAPGAYELRYQSDREKNVVFARRPITVR